MTDLAPIMTLDFAPTTRRCGDCQLCCRLLPASDIGKPGNTKCQHQKHGVGCRIYARRPVSCRMWSCRWLTMHDTADLRRPDRSHYVVDVMPDYVTAQHNETGEERVIPVIQIWCDPKHRDAHRDPALRAYLERRADEGWAGLVRYGQGDALLIVAPAMSPDGQWHETTSMLTQPEHSVIDTINSIATGVDHARAID